MSLKGIFEAVNKVTDENTINRILKFSSTKIPRKEAEGVLQKISGYKFSGKAKALMYGIGGAYVLSDIVGEGKTKAGIGEINASPLANTITSPVSPELKRQLKEYDNGDQEQLTDRFNATNSPVSAELVYALHELSGQGGI